VFALIFVKTVPGSEEDLLREIPEIVGDNLVKVDGSQFCFEFAGPYDIILGVSFESLETFRSVLAKIRNLKGVVDTLTSIAVK